MSKKKVSKIRRLHSHSIVADAVQLVYPQDVRTPLPFNLAVADDKNNKEAVDGSKRHRFFECGGVIIEIVLQVGFLGMPITKYLPTDRTDCVEHANKQFRCYTWLDFHSTRSREIC